MGARSKHRGAHRPSMRAPWALVVLLVPALAGCLQDDTLVAALSAPLDADGLTIFAVRGDGSENGPSLQANYEIRYQGRIVYPPAGAGGILILNQGRGSQFVPYHFFVEGNGPYEVVVRLEDQVATASVSVEKWVEYVYLHPYWKNGRALVDLQLSKGTGGQPDDRVVARGDLLLEVRYRGLDQSLNSYAGVIRAKTPDDRTFTRIDVPSSTFSKGPGWYSFESTFNNDQAKGNTNVKNDPTMASRSPPWNWIYVPPS